MSTTALIEMACGRPERHKPDCTLPGRTLDAYEKKLWPTYRVLEGQVQARYCGCRDEDIDPDRRCPFEGPVDVELSGPNEYRRCDWTCPRCLAAHIDEEV